MFSGTALKYDDCSRNLNEMGLLWNINVITNFHSGKREHQSKCKLLMYLIQYKKGYYSMRRHAHWSVLCVKWKFC